LQKAEQEEEKTVKESKRKKQAIEENKETRQGTTILLPYSLELVW